MVMEEAGKLFCGLIQGFQSLTSIFCFQFHLQMRRHWGFSHGVSLLYLLGRGRKCPMLKAQDESLKLQEGVLWMD